MDKSIYIGSRLDSWPFRGDCRPALRAEGGFGLESEIAATWRLQVCRRWIERGDIVGRGRSGND